MINLLGIGIVLFGLADQPIQKTWLDFDRLAPNAKPKLTYNTGGIEIKFLGTDARFTTTVDSWQMWLLLHPEVTSRKDIARDEKSHRDVAARFTVRYLKNGESVKDEVIESTVEGKFTKFDDCWGCPENVRPANIVKTTAETTVPAGADEMVIELRAVEHSTQKVSTLGGTISRRLTLQGNPVHLYTRIQDFKPLWRVVDADGLYADRPTEVIYTHERAMSYLTWIEKKMLAAVDKIELCSDKTKTQLKVPIRADVNMMQLRWFMKYRFDGGPWSEELPNQTFTDLKDVVFPSAWEHASGFLLPAGGDAKNVELSFRIEGLVDVDRSMCESYKIAFGDKIVVNYPKGHKIALGSVVDSGIELPLK